MDVYGYNIDFYQNCTVLTVPLTLNLPDVKLFNDVNTLCVLNVVCTESADQLLFSI